MPRLLQLAQRREMPVTWFWPGHSIETFPEQFEATVAAGHEIGVHGYSHENPIAMTREQETEILDYCTDLVAAGAIPSGDLNPFQARILAALLLSHGTSAAELPWAFEAHL